MFMLRGRRWIPSAVLAGLLFAANGAAAGEPPAVKELRQRGVLQGYPGGKFEPNKPVTRLELAVILSRLLRAIESNPAAAQSPSPPSVPVQPAPVPKGVPAWAYNEVRDLVDRGFVVEHPELWRDLQRPASQRDVVTCLVWALTSLAKRGYIPPGDLGPGPAAPIPE